MKKIGSGWQYTAYDLGNGRVLKKFNPAVRGYWLIGKDIFPFTGDKLWEIPGFYSGCKRFALSSLKLVQSTTLELWRMGNPKLLNTLDYEQDKVTPIHDAFDSLTIEESKRIVDDFIKLNEILFEKNLIDKSFNITKNFGLDAEGRVILMDLGELQSDQVKIETQRASRAWAKHYIVDPIKNEEVRAYFISRMDQTFGIK